MKAKRHGAEKMIADGRFSKGHYLMHDRVFVNQILGGKE
jgi:hypothetical protein